MSARLNAGVGRADITDYAAGPVNDPLYATALALRQGAAAAVLVTLDVVAVEAIGGMPAGFVEGLRQSLQSAIGIDPACVIAAASHCHGRVCADVGARALEAALAAWRAMEPVRAGCGAGLEARISENRRVRLRDGREADVRHAYALPPDCQIAGIGPVDPEIGVLRLDRDDGRTLAVVFNFACHPIMGVPGGGNTADIAGFASRAIEDAFGGGAAALFVQGCAGDINPIGYKDTDHPRDAEPLGERLGLSAVRAARRVDCTADAALCLAHRTLGLPRADLAPAIDALQAEQDRLVGALRGTTLDFKTFLALSSRYGLAPEHPSAPAHRYLRECAIGAAGFQAMDERNRRDIAVYAANIDTMERLTRLHENLSLLTMHHRQNEDAAGRDIEAEVAGLRVGDFRLLTFPGELSAEIGLRVKARSPHAHTYLATCAGGYVYYAPTAEQLQNRGWAQEDSDCLLDARWQPLFEEGAAAILSAL